MKRSVPTVPKRNAQDNETQINIPGEKMLIAKEKTRKHAPGSSNTKTYTQRSNTTKASGTTKPKKQKSKPTKVTKKLDEKSEEAAKYRRMRFLNNIASKISRDRKKEKISKLADEITTLESRNEYLRDLKAKLLTQRQKIMDAHLEIAKLLRESGSKMPTKISENSGDHSTLWTLDRIKGWITHLTPSALSLRIKNISGFLHYIITRGTNIASNADSNPPSTIFVPFSEDQLFHINSVLRKRFSEDMQRHRIDINHFLWWKLVPECLFKLVMEETGLSRAATNRAFKTIAHPSSK